MKNKLRFLIGQSLKKKLNTKWFKVANVLILILLIAVLNMDHLISFFGGDFENSTKIYVVDEIGAYDLFQDQFESVASSLDDLGNYELENSTDDINDLQEKIKDEKSLIVQILPSDTNYIEVLTYSFEPLSMVTKQALQASFNNVKSIYVLENSGLTVEEIASLTSDVEIKSTITNEEVEGNSEGKDIISSGLIIIFIIPFFLLITMLTQMIGAEINDEKSTRGMEIIISNVSPKVHFLSKIISATLFVIIQSLILIVDIVIGLLIRKLLGNSLMPGSTAGFIGEAFNVVQNTGVIDLLLKGLPIIIILFLLSFLAYAIVAGVLASMTTNIEDYQQLQTPLMIILMVGYYIAIMASTFDGSIFVKIISYIPMLSFLVAPVIYLLGQISIWELTLSTVICGVVTYLFFYYGLRIYKVGILNYSSQNLWKKIFKSVKNKS